jgi:dihydroxyacid dehydratase/phosphogluconate dehydratase
MPGSHRGVRIGACTDCRKNWAKFRAGTIDMDRRIDDTALDVSPNIVLVLQHIGPVGNPGMPEAGLLPIPRKLADKGVQDMLRISDGRMSGTAGGPWCCMCRPRRRILQAHWE